MWGCFSGLVACKADDVTKVMLKIDKLISIDDLIYPLRPSLLLHEYLDFFMYVLDVIPRFNLLNFSS